jgi:PLAT/LH2 domain
MKTTRSSISLITFLMLADAGMAFAFDPLSAGTERERITYGDLAFASVGSGAEHERITRLALGCAHGNDPSWCFQPTSLDEIAGKKNLYGAVGQPDDFAGHPDMLGDKYHCDNSNLDGCRTHMDEQMNVAVADAKKLLKDSSGKGVMSLDGSQIPTAVTCNFNGSKGRAKCNVIEAFGMVLHASQDFYAHSNWNDREAPEPLSLDNPKGLGNIGLAPWLDLRTKPTFPPEGLITGCFDNLSIVDPRSKFACPGRVKHEFLNKDKGSIDLNGTIGLGTTERGKIGNNFKLAVEAAIADTRDKWATLRERLVAKYGATRGNQMICAIKNDNPTETCVSTVAANTTMSYEVRIKTGNKTGAGTDSNIYLTLDGVLGRTREIQVNQFISGNAFERNKTDTFTLKNIPTIGEYPRSVKIRSDGKYPGSAWYLESITINGKTAQINQWIDTGSLTVEVPLF